MVESSSSSFESKDEEGEGTSAKNDLDHKPYFYDADNEAVADAKEPLAAPPPYETTEPELQLLHSKPITSSLRTTMRHLHQHAGPLSHFRGFGVLILSTLLLELLRTSINLVFGISLPAQLLGLLFSQVLLVRLSLLWTHIVISEPNRQKRWYQRFVTRRAAKKVVVPTIALTLLGIAVPVVPLAACWLVGLDANTWYYPSGRKEWALVIVIAKVLAVLVAGLGFLFCVFVPAFIACTRVYAAQLPEDETPIVPFDRTFGGLVVAESEGGSGKLKLKDAWRSFGWSDLVRLAKVYMRVVGLQLAVAVGFVGVLGASMMFVNDGTAQRAG